MATRNDGDVDLVHRGEFIAELGIRTSAEPDAGCQGVIYREYREPYSDSLFRPADRVSASPVTAGSVAPVTIRFIQSPPPVTKIVIHPNIDVHDIAH